MTFESDTMRILFVCTGNICRSPTAERLARLAGVEASSAGTRAVIGHPMHPEAARVLADLGGDPSEFVARQLKPQIAGDADLVLAMTAFHRDAVLEMAPRQLRRTFTLTEISALTGDFEPADVADLAGLRPHLRAEQVADVVDPIGQGPEVFDRVGLQIAELLRPVLEFCRRV